jgi:hypothetical protein
VLSLRRIIVEMTHTTNYQGEQYTADVCEKCMNLIHRDMAKEGTWLTKKT